MFNKYLPAANIVFYLKGIKSIWIGNTISNSYLYAWRVKYIGSWMKIRIVGTVVSFIAIAVTSALIIYLKCEYVKMFHAKLFFKDHFVEE